MGGLTHAANGDESCGSQVRCHHVGDRQQYPDKNPYGYRRSDDPAALDGRDVLRR